MDQGQHPPVEPKALALPKGVVVKACPFCGAEPRPWRLFDLLAVSCRNPECLIHNQDHSENDRPEVRRSKTGRKSSKSCTTTSRLSFKKRNPYVCHS